MSSELEVVAVEETQATPVVEEKVEGAETKQENAPEQKQEEKTPEQKEHEKLKRDMARKTAALGAANQKIRDMVERLERLENNGRQAQSQANSYGDKIVVIDGQEFALRDVQEFIEKEALAHAEKLAAERAEYETVAQKRDRVMKDGAAYENWDDICNEVNEELPFYSENGKPTAFLEALFELDKPAQVLDYLHAHPDKAAELAGFSAVKLARELTRIEGIAPSAPERSKTPKPLSTVSGKGSTTPSLGSMSQAEYEAWRTKQGRRN